ncbi:hypothetical protein HY411_01035 [Candidatus Gottesmanbacteria bacterium]|nr:hypothetical protein [Candidatus Gottesmanbacteria bacterium]
MKQKNVWRAACALVLFGMTSVSFFRATKPVWMGYTTPYYTDAVYQGLESAFNQSQYRQKEHPGFIPDETIFSYAAGAYVRGMDPILVNSEHTPLGKYIIGVFILLMKNDKFTVIPFSLLSLVAVWLIGRMALKDSTLALVPVAILATEPLFLNQIRTAPLLDIIQLPWILLSIAAFLWEREKRTFFTTAVMIGLVMATKTVVPAVLLVGTFAVYLLMLRRAKDITRLFLCFPVSVGIFIASYARTFMSGYTLFDFIGFQKWIFFYQQSKLMFPLSSWRLLLLNQWQAWWGDMSVLAADDWRWTWPASTLLGTVAFGLLAMRRISFKEPIALLVLWFAVYSAFLSLGVVSSRFFLPLFPISFIVGVWVLRQVYERIIFH